MNMKNAIRALLLISLFTSNALQLAAQDVHFTQTVAGIDWLNPGASGALSTASANLIYRDQWAAVGEGYTTVFASGQFRLGKQSKKRGFSSAGIQAFNDRAGDARLNTLNAGLTYAYHVRLDDHQTLGAGVYAGYLQRRFSQGALQWGTQYDGTQYNSALAGEIAGNDQRSLLDLAAGFCWTWKSSEAYMTANNQQMFRIGAGAWHLTRPNLAFNGTDPLGIRLSVHGDALVGLSNTPLALLPSVLWQQQGKQSELLLGSLVRYTVRESSRYTGFVSSSSIAVGAYWRNRDAAALAANYQWGNYSLGISYDVNVSGLRTSTNGRGGFEVTFRYTAGKSIGASSPIN